MLCFKGLVCRLPPAQTARRVALTTSACAPLKQTCEGVNKVTLHLPLPPTAAAPPITQACHRSLPTGKAPPPLLPHAGMYKATRHRWLALEVQTQAEEREVMDQLEEGTSSSVVGVWLGLGLGLV